MITARDKTSLSSTGKVDGTMCIFWVCIVIVWSYIIFTVFVHDYMR